MALSSPICLRGSTEKKNTSSLPAKFDFHSMNFSRLAVGVSICFASSASRSISSSCALDSPNSCPGAHSSGFYTANSLASCLDRLKSLFRRLMAACCLFFSFQSLSYWLRLVISKFEKLVLDLSCNASTVSLRQTWLLVSTDEKSPGCFCLSPDGEGFDFNGDLLGASPEPN